MELLTAPADVSPSSLKLKKILVPVDFSPLSENAFRYALRLSTEFQSDLTILHVFEPIVPVAFEGLALNLPPATDTEETSSANKALRSMVGLAREHGVARAKSRLSRGLASHEIVEVARELDVDLIVIATHGYSGWKHFCIGSTAERVVRAAPCPVLVVRDKEHDFI